MKLDSTLLNRAVPPGSMRYYAWLYTPEIPRDVIAALFLIENELHDTARAPHEVAHIRLQWWREEIDRLIAGKAQHPATRVLQAASHARVGRFDAAQRPDPVIELATKGNSLPIEMPAAEPSRSVLPTSNETPAINFELLHQAHLSAAQELANATFETDTELTQYLRGGLGGVFQLAAQYLSDNPSAAALDAATQLGAFVRQVETLRDLRQDFHHGRLYLPLAKLDELNIEYEALQSDAWPESFVDWLKIRCQQQLNEYQTLKQGLLSQEKQHLRPLLVLSELHGRVLEIIASDIGLHTQQRVELSPIRKLWIAWRTARAA